MAFGFLKPALLQSLPWAAVLIVPLFELLRRRSTAHALPFLILAVWVLPFAYLQWHGGFSFNMRYFVPLLPFVAMLGAAGLERIVGPRQRHCRHMFPAIVIAGIALYLWFTGFRDLGSRQSAFVQVYVPLLLSGFIAVLFLASIMMQHGGRLHAWTFAMVRLLVMTALIWSGGVAAATAFILSQTVRDTLERERQELLGQLPNDCLVLTGSMKIVVPLKANKRKLRVAAVGLDAEEDVIALARYYASSGVPVFVYGSESMIQLQPKLRAADEVWPDLEVAAASTGALWRLMLPEVPAMLNSGGAESMGSTERPQPAGKIREGRNDNNR